MRIFGGASASWHYAQDMTDAFEVVHLWQENRPPLSLTYQNQLDKPFNQFFWSTQFSGSAWGFGYVETAPAAISLAALRAFDIERFAAFRAITISSGSIPQLTQEITALADVT